MAANYVEIVAALFFSYFSYLLFSFCSLSLSVPAKNKHFNLITCLVQLHLVTQALSDLSLAFCSLLHSQS